jgi:hypothetical protein
MKISRAISTADCASQTSLLYKAATFNFDSPFKCTSKLLYSFHNKY